MSQPRFYQSTECLRPEEFQCGYCNALPDNPCVTKSSNERQSWDFHMDRSIQAWNKNVETGLIMWTG